MDNVVEIIRGSSEAIAYIIPHIKGMKICGNTIAILINGANGFDIYECVDDNKARSFYDHYLAKIDAYYQAMMPPKDNNVDAAKEIILLQDEAKRAQETVSRLANFISVLYCHTMGDREIALPHLDDKMKRLEQWVADKAKEGK